MKEEHVARNLFLAALSLSYAKKSGYNMKMYTDSFGYSLLKGFGYDEITTELDDIPYVHTPQHLFSIGKYYAMQREDIGNIHTDFDVLIKKPCLDEFMSGKGDVIVQVEEVIHDDTYENSRQFLLKNETPKLVDISKEITHVHNVGVIGFNNKELRDRFLSAYFEVVEMYREKPLPMSLDFIIEQGYLKIICDSMGIKITTLISALCQYDNPKLMKEVNRIADEIGYCHLQGNGKEKTENQEKVKERLKELNEPLYNHVVELTNNL